MGAALPGLSIGLAAGFDGINLALPDIQARLDALLAFHVTPFSFSASLQLAVDIVANIQAAISIGLPSISIDAQLALVLELIGQLKITIGLIRFQLSIILDLQGLLVNAGAHLWHYSGAASALGADMTATLAAGVPGGSGGAANIDALIMATELPVTWSAIASILKTVP